MPELPKHENCYGCAACANICPRHCIEMRTNSYGELRPYVRLNQCVECGCCTRVCPMLHPSPLYTPCNVYAMSMTDGKNKIGSASGGAARMLYEYALEQGMTVFGCDFDGNRILRMRSANHLDEIEGFRNSKYTFSRMGDVYSEIKGLLQKNIFVLFIGLSCQVDALLNFLGGHQAGLLTVDLLCHGVPPEQYFVEYMQHMEKKLKRSIDNIQFRGNDRKNDFYLKLHNKEHLIYERYAREDAYYMGYVQCMMFETRCYNCHFAQKKRVSDITIADWWGATGIVNEKVSLLMTNTGRGQDAVNNLQNQNAGIWERHTLDEALSVNEQLRESSLMPENHMEMREYYKNNGFNKFSQKYIVPRIKVYQKKKHINQIRMFVHIPVRALRKLKRLVKKA